jgi:hypothetical protein
VQWADKAIGYAETYSTDLGQEIGHEAARAVAEALNTKGIALALLGRNVEAVQAIERGVAVAEAASLHSVACRAYTNLGVLYSVVDPTRAIGALPSITPGLQCGHANWRADGRAHADFHRRRSASSTPISKRIASTKKYARGFGWAETTSL